MATVAFDLKNRQVADWDADTTQACTTVNGVEAKGGSLDGSGPVVVNARLYVNSGYIFAGHTPGNVLLAFSVDGR